MIAYSTQQLDPALPNDSRHDGALFKKFIRSASCPSISHKATVGWVRGARVLVSPCVSGDRLVSRKGLLLMSYPSLSQSLASNLSLSFHLDALFFLSFFFLLNETCRNSILFETTGSSWLKFASELRI